MKFHGKKRKSFKFKRHKGRIIASIMNISWDTGAASSVRSQTEKQTEKQKSEIETASGCVSQVTHKHLSPFQESNTNVQISSFYMTRPHCPRNLVSQVACGLMEAWSVHCTRLPVILSLFSIQTPHHCHQSES